MGFSLPATVGAKVAAPHKTIIDIDGDASFRMTTMEPQTASQFGIGVKVPVLNNRFQGIVLQRPGKIYSPSSCLPVPGLLPFFPAGFRSLLRR
jgi:thiamine pyrophosphate-dependent acetolactate synthase large subunit-like protein